jgi:type III secretory pathway component EscV
MFIVKNVSKKEVSINSLHISIEPDQQLDIDSVCARFHSEQSFALKQMIIGGLLKVIIKDDHRGGIQVKTPEIAMPEEMPEYVPKNKDVINAVKQLEEKLTKTIDSKIQNAQPAIDPSLLSKAVDALQALAVQQNSGNSGSGKVLESIDGEKAVAIQKRTLDRIAKNTESNVIQSEQVVDNSNVQRNTDELNNLL